MAITEKHLKRALEIIYSKNYFNKKLNILEKELSKKRKLHKKNIYNMLDDNIIKFCVEKIILKDVEKNGY